MSAEFRRILELLLANVDLIALKPRIIGQKRPWQRVIVLADPHEAPKAHDRVSDLTARLVDHHPFDPANLLAI
jgi:hypothetical protein